MSPETIDNAADEARRFLDRVDAARDAFQFRKFSNSEGGYYSNENTLATAALRRSSLDLTRSLADLRRGRS